MGDGDFGLWMLRQRYAVRSIKTYGRTIERIDGWLRERRKTLRRATWKDLRGYAETLPYTYASRSALQSALKAYWAFLGRRDCPAWAVPCPKKPRMIPRPVTREELDRVLEAADSKGPAVYALMVCLYYLGLRRAEAAALRWADFREDGRVRVVGKGGIEAWLPVRREIVLALEQLKRQSEFVFSGRWGGHIAAGTVNLWVTVVSELAGVDMHPHRFRHTAITNAYEGTGDVFAVQEFARHADPRTTRGYTRVGWERVVSAIAAL